MPEISNNLTPFKPITDDEKGHITEIRNLCNSVNENSDISNEADYKKKVIEYSDTKIMRFLRGRKWVVDKTYRALIRHAEWRTQNNVEDITIADIESELNTGKIIIKGKDLLNRPCVSVLARKHRKEIRDLEVMKKLIIHSLEEIVKVSLPEEEKMVLIFDLHEFSFACMDYEVIKLLIEILQFNYPETLAHAIILNAPFIFSACWVVIKPWLDPDTRAKVLFLTSNELPKYVNVASLPETVHLTH